MSSLQLVERHENDQYGLDLVDPLSAERRTDRTATLVPVAPASDELVTITQAARSAGWRTVGIQLTNRAGGAPSNADDLEDDLTDLAVSGHPQDVLNRLHEAKNLYIDSVTLETRGRHRVKCTRAGRVFLMGPAEEEREVLVDSLLDFFRLALEMP